MYNRTKVDREIRRFKRSLAANKAQTYAFYNAGKSVVELLSNPDNDICPQLGTTIGLGDVLGAGAEGTVYEVVSSDKKLIPEFVAKGAAADYELAMDEAQGPVDDAADQVDAQHDIPKNVLKAFNKNHKETKKRVIPTFAIRCITKTPTRYRRVVEPHDNIVYPAGSYICENHAFSEYLIGLLMGQLAKSGKSMNFIRMDAMVTCADPVDDPEVHAPMTYTFMERISGSVKSLASDEGLTEEELRSIVIQTLHAIVVYQREYKVMHNDLHPGNVMYVKVTEETMWNDKRLMDYDYIQYDIRDLSDGSVDTFYLPRPAYIVKIGDFGFSCKYSSPVVAAKRVFNDGISTPSYVGPWMPNFYNAAYDPLYTLSAFLSYNSEDNFIINLIFYLLGYPKKNGDYTYADYQGIEKEFFDDSANRPFVNKLTERNIADALNDAYFMEEYFLRPEGSILLIGTA